MWPHLEVSDGMKDVSKSLVEVDGAPRGVVEDHRAIVCVALECLDRDLSGRGLLDGHTCS